MEHKTIEDGGFYVKSIADSVNIFGNRITTLELKYPRFIHAEIMTHRDRARNSASSRAIPWPKMMERIVNDPVIPIQFGSEKKGMQTGESIENEEEATKIWLEARDDAVRHAKRLAELGVHKSLCNRITEPWMWIVVVMTATDWANLFRLRVHPDTEIHFQKLAEMMREMLGGISNPKVLQHGQWHLPYVSDQEVAEYLANVNTISEINLNWKAISTARCARVSYLTQDGKRDLSKDLELFDRLCQGSGFGHWSPHEHPATPATPDVKSGPYRGWIQYRKFFQNECAKDYIA